MNSLGFIHLYKKLIEKEEIKPQSFVYLIFSKRITISTETFFI